MERRLLLNVEIDIRYLLLWRAYRALKAANDCEAQGKGRARGRLRKVPQRSFIDCGLSIININFPVALH